MGEDRRGESQASRRLTVQAAAVELGITEAAVRNRIKRGTLRAEREGGRVYVVLAGAANRGEPSDQSDEPRDEPSDQSELIAVLREQLAAEREANRENRRIIAVLASRVPQLEAPREAHNRPERGLGEGGGGEVPQQTESGVSRPWRRRWLGG